MPEASHRPYTPVPLTAVRIDGGFWFGRRAGAWLPYVNPVSAAFALQALDVWRIRLAGGAPAHCHQLI